MESETGIETGRNLEFDLDGIRNCGRWGRRGINQPKFTGARGAHPRLPKRHQRFHTSPGAGAPFNVRIHAAMANHDLETDDTIFQKQQAEKHRCIELDKYTRVRSMLKHACTILT